MHFLKCLAIGIAVASGFVGAIVGVQSASGAIYDWLYVKFGWEKAANILRGAGVFLLIATLVTLGCYTIFATATHN